MMDDPDLRGVNSNSDSIEQVYWALFPENTLLLKTALYQTVKIYGSIDRFASICGVPFEDFYRSIKEGSLDLKFFYKVFPYILPQLKCAFDQYIEDETKKELRDLFSKNGLDSNEDLVNVVNKTITDFESSEKREKYEKIAQYLTELSNSFQNQYEAEKKTEEAKK